MIPNVLTNGSQWEKRVTSFVRASPRINHGTENITYEMQNDATGERRKARAQCELIESTVSILSRQRTASEADGGNNGPI